MESIQDKEKLLEFWHTYGKIKEIANIVNVINPITSASSKKFNYCKVADPLYYEIELNKNLFKNHWYIIDVDIESKNNQKILASKPELFTTLKNSNKIKYCELSMNKGIHMLVNTDSSILVPWFKKKIKLNNNIETVLRIEFKSKCLVAPSHDYKFQFKNLNAKQIRQSKFSTFLKYLLGLFNHFRLFDFAGGDMTIPTDLFRSHECKESNDSSSSSSDYDSSDSENEYPELIKTDSLKRKSIENAHESIGKPSGTKRKLINKDKDDDDDENAFKLSSIKLNPYYNKLYDIFLTYKKAFCSNSNEINTNNEFLEFQNNFEFFVSNLFKRNSCIYFSDLALFILSILHRDNFPLEKDHPFYVLSDTEKWITWTTAYLNFTDMLTRNYVSTSYRSNIKFDRNPLYRSITKINMFGSDLTDEQSRDELDMFRKKYSKPAYFQMNITKEFINFILTTLSILEMDLWIHFSVNNFFRMFGNVKKNVTFGVSLFKRYTSKYHMKIIKTSQKPKSGSKCGEGFIYMEHLYWQNFQGNENFIDYLISIIYPSLGVAETDHLKAEILQMGKSRYLK